MALPPGDIKHIASYNIVLQAFAILKILRQYTAAKIGVANNYIEVFTLGRIYSLGCVGPSVFGMTHDSATIASPLCNIFFSLSSASIFAYIIIVPIFQWQLSLLLKIPIKSGADMRNRVRL